MDIHVGENSFLKCLSGIDTDVNKTSSGLQPPFSASDSAALKPGKANALGEAQQKRGTSRETGVLPGSYYENRFNRLRIVDEDDEHSLRDYFEWELDVSRLNEIHEYLWLAARRTAPRPLHRQIMLGREVIITEQADLHLLWREHWLYLKPLPDFLTDRAVWKDHCAQTGDFTSPPLASCCLTHS
jgi:hypothetical protein